MCEECGGLIAAGCFLACLCFICLCAVFVSLLTRKREIAKYSERKAYLEKYIIDFCKTAFEHCLFDEITDFHEYVLICTKLGYKDHEIMNMLNDLVAQAYVQNLKH
ncbi:MAG: hypothetical protein E7663_01635 [Ruminococcaceae bacterium]|nr:hypothetical protein [Oscillospiraceae bacterium]